MTLDENIDAEILIVAGGGAGGSSLGTGGGAGGLVYIPMEEGYTLSSGTYKIQVGAGGSGMANSTDSSGATSRGTNSSLTFVETSSEILTAIGGANGNGQSTAYYGTNSSSGGSGAGGVRHRNNPGDSLQKTSTSISSDSRIFGFGNAGGSGITNDPYSSGGGGGAGSQGKIGNINGGGDGGDGKQIAITGENLWYAAGGGGSSNDSGLGIGGSGIGGDALLGGTGNNGADNTGSGGGGVTSGDRGGLGGSGIVIIRISN